MAHKKTKLIYWVSVFIFSASVFSGLASSLVSAAGNPSGSITTTENVTATGAPFSDSVLVVVDVQISSLNGKSVGSNTFSGDTIVQTGSDSYIDDAAGKQVVQIPSAINLAVYDVIDNVQLGTYCSPGATTPTTILPCGSDYAIPGDQNGNLTITPGGVIYYQANIDPSLDDPNGTQDVAVGKGAVLEHDPLVGCPSGPNITLSAKCSDSSASKTNWLIADDTTNPQTLGHTKISLPLKNYVAPADLAASAISTQATSGSSGSTNSSPELQCTIQILNPLTWLLCPIISAAEGFVGQLDNAISSLLTVNVDTYLDQTGASGVTGQEFYQAWNSFRIFALALIVIAALVMIITQALGVEAVSAYSLKKLMPRLIIAIIAITLSWEIMKLLVQFSDDLGHDISGIIYSPFSGAVTKINDGAISGLGIASAGGLLLLGPVGVLAFILTAAVAVLVGFATLVLRKILILAFIILAPIAIACAILPATQKVWKMWSSNFMRALIMFPLIAGFIAVGRVFAVIAGDGGGSGFEDDIIKLVAWFGPYFMIPLTFKMAGGIMGSIGGIAGNISSRARQPLAALGRSQVPKNWNNIKAGKRWAGGNEQNLRGKFNRTLKRATLIPKAGLRPKDFNTKMRQAMRDSDADQLDSLMKGENRSFNSWSGDDAKVSAAKFNTAEQVESELARFDPGRFAGESNRASRQEARAQIMQTKREVSSTAFQKARIRAMAKTGTGYQYTDENGQTQFDASRMMTDINSAYGDDRNGAGQALAEMRTSLQQSGQMAGAAGYGAWASNMEALHRGTITAKQAHESLMDDAINSVSPGQAIYGKPASAAAMGAAHARRIQRIADSIRTNTAIDMGRKDAQGNAIKEIATKEHLSVAMAGAAGIYDAMNQASPANASAFANELMSKEVNTDVPYVDTNGEQKTDGKGSVRQLIETQMGSNPEFVNRRRDMSRTSIEEARYLAEQQKRGLNPDQGQFDLTQGPNSGPPLPPPVI